MDEEMKKIIEERMAKLPSDLKSAISSIDLESAFSEITKRNRLLIDQAGILQNEILMTVLGIEPLANFVSNISRELSIPSEKALEIAKNTDELIFKNIRSYLQKLNQEEDEIEGKEIAGSRGETSDILDRDSLLNEIENPQKNIYSEKSRINVNKIDLHLPMNEPENDISVRETNLPQKTDGINITNDISKEKIDNILETNLTKPVSLERENQTTEEKTKIPAKDGGDPYREPLE